MHAVITSVAATSSFLSPSAAPFFPEVCSSGRPKALRWSKDVYDCSNEDYSVEMSSPKVPSFLDVVRQQSRLASPLPVRA
jgi:hypothetical protein